MNLLKVFFRKNKKDIVIKQDVNRVFLDQYDEIGKLVKEARIKKNISIAELSRISKIPQYTINSIENNDANIRPKHPFIRSILFKLENCLSLKKNILVDLLVKEKNNYKRDKKEIILRKFDFINTWQGTVFYFLIMILTLFILKRYFHTNINIIEMQNVQEKIKGK